MAGEYHRSARRVRTWAGEEGTALEHRITQHVTPLLDLFARLSPADHVTREEVEEAVVAHATGTDLTTGAGALLALLRRQRRDPDAGAVGRWLDLDDAKRVALLLLDIEAVPLDAAAGLLACSPELLRDAHERASRALVLESADLVIDCPGRATVARVHRVSGDEGIIALRHLATCAACAGWHATRQDRRRFIALLAPNVGVTGIGYVLDPPR